MFSFLFWGGWTLNGVKRSSWCICVFMYFMLYILLRCKWPIGPFAFNKLKLPSAGMVRWNLHSVSLSLRSSSANDRSLFIARCCSAAKPEIVVAPSSTFFCRSDFACPFSTSGWIILSKERGVSTTTTIACAERLTVCGNNTSHWKVRYTYRLISIDD